VNWYFATLLFERNRKSLVQRSMQRCHYLIAADNHDGAYEKSMRHGNRLSKRDIRFVGVSDLLQVYDTPDDGAELLWSQIEITPAELENEIREKERMQAFQAERPNPSGWYVGDVVLYEVHDEGSHGENLLVWINSYLIRANNVEAAYLKAVQIGKKQEDEPGSHLCGGEKAHWQLKGVQDMVPVHDAPADAALLWCEDIKAISKVGSMVPKKSDLGVFKWQAEQLRQRASQQTEL
jgi:hypothetical protein